MKTIIMTALCLFCATSSFAAGGVVINGDLTLEQKADPPRVLYFSDGSPQLYASPWSYNTPGVDIFFNLKDSNVGIGNFAPTERLDVTGTIMGTSTAGNGVKGVSTSGHGLIGTSTSNAAILGVHGGGDSNYNISSGVAGYSTSGIGVYGSSQSNSGVNGSSTNGDGVVGYSLNGFAGNFEGNVNVSGKISAGSNGLAVGTNQLVVSEGNVGIGNSTPTTKLDVTGTVKATSFQGDGSALTNIISPRFVYNQNSNSSVIGASCTNYLSVTIYAPANGWLDVSATLNVTISHALGTSDWFLAFIGSSNNDCSDMAGMSQITIPASIASTDIFSSVSPRHVNQAGGGYYYTYYLNGYMFAGQDSNDKFNVARIYATWYPYAAPP